MSRTRYRERGIHTYITITRLDYLKQGTYLEQKTRNNEISVHISVLNYKIVGMVIRLCLIYISGGEW